MLEKIENLESIFVVGFGIIATAFVVLVVVVIIIEAFKKDKAGAGKVNSGDSTDYSLKNIKK